MTFDTFLAKVESEIIDPAITVLALAAFILFAFGVFELIRNADNEEARATGRQHVIWGLVGLTILFSAGVIVKLLTKIVS